MDLQLIDLFILTNIFEQLLSSENYVGEWKQNIKDKILVYKRLPIQEEKNGKSVIKHVKSNKDIQMVPWTWRT